eukprot:scaffold682_cov363-Pavlova_lutheri.AAC.49
MYLHVSCTYLANNGNRSYCCRYHNEPMIRLWSTRGMDAIRDQEVQFHEKKALGKTTSTHNAYWSDEGGIGNIVKASQPSDQLHTCAKGLDPFTQGFSRVEYHVVACLDSHVSVARGAYGGWEKVWIIYMCSLSCATCAQASNRSRLTLINHL